MQDLNLELFHCHDINAVLEKEVELRLALEQAENINSVHAVGVDDYHGVM